MRATSSTTACTWSGVIVATEPTSSPVAGLKLSRVDWAGGAPAVVAIPAILGRLRLCLQIAPAQIGGADVAQRPRQQRRHRSRGGSDELQLTLFCPAPGNAETVSQLGVEQPGGDQIDLMDR